MKIYHNVSIKHLNTFGVDVKAKRLIIVECENDLLQVSEDAFINPFFCVGQGSNLLFTKNFKGTIIKIEMNKWELVDRKDDDVFIRADAGCIWDDFVYQTLQNNFFGLENLSLIPGTVGSAPVQNIGAYGAEASQFIESVNIFDLKQRAFIQIENAQCNFDYRNSIFKSKREWIVVSVNFRLKSIANTINSYKALSEYLQKNNLDGQNPLVLREAVIAIRESKLPDYRKIGNAGSFFQNPVVEKDVFGKLQKDFSDIPFYIEKDDKYKIPAAWLIEKLGWKGYKNDNVGVYENQPLILINCGNATGLEIKNLSENIQTSIKNNFGIQLHPEVIIL